MEINLPLIGSLHGEYELFQYLIQNASSDHVHIVIPNWVIGRFRLRTSDIVNLHSSFKLKDNYYSRGLVVSGQETYTIQLIDPKPQKKPFGFFDINQSIYIFPEDLSLIKLIKNMLMIKRGISVYVKHLIPYFSRITGIEKDDYSTLKRLLLNDIQTLLKRNMEFLNTLYHKLEESKDTANLLDTIQIEELHTCIQPEINLDILNLTFGDLAHLPYIVCIKELEEELYWNYNSVVISYAASLSIVQ